MKEIGQGVRVPRPPRSANDKWALVKEYWSKYKYLVLTKGSFTSYDSESNFFLWSLSLLSVNIKLDALWTHLEVMSISLPFQHKRVTERNKKPFSRKANRSLANMNKVWTGSSKWTSWGWVSTEEFWTGRGWERAPHVTDQWHHRLYSHGDLLPKQRRLKTS